MNDLRGAGSPLGVGLLLLAPWHPMQQAHRHALLELLLLLACWLVG